MELGRIVVWRRESLPHSTSYPLLMLILQNVLIKYTHFCTPKCSPYAGVWLWRISGSYSQEMMGLNLRWLLVCVVVFLAFNTTNLDWGVKAWLFKSSHGYLVNGQALMEKVKGQRLWFTELWNCQFYFCFTKSGISHLVLRVRCPLCPGKCTHSTCSFEFSLATHYINITFSALLHWWTKICES